MKKMLISQLNNKGYWEGELSSSALSTATAIFALYTYNPTDNILEIKRGLKWLDDNINDDGGYGDTPDSYSNLTTTIIVWSLFGLIDNDFYDCKNINKQTEKYLAKHIYSMNYPAPRGGEFNPLVGLKPDDIISTILNHYGNDRTFAVPILVVCAISGRLGPYPQCWKEIPQLPFEISIIPHSLFKIIKLPVVSYALPALITMGIVKDKHWKTSNPLSKIIRYLTKPFALKLLSKLQPENGGFLEAIPLTSFVVISLIASKEINHPVVAKGIEFLLKSSRTNGSFPIDTNLATWLTTLSVKALPKSALSDDQKTGIRNWLLNQQFKVKHPYTNSPPGGWAWTDLPGGTPDADDTAGVLIALDKLLPGNNSNKEEMLARSATISAAEDGIKWLLKIQNSDGGIPTFCKGWGSLPFDRSCPDITGHALQAFAIWREQAPLNLKKKMSKSIDKMIKYLRKTQESDGSWCPLWFGNQNSSNQKNPIYGTSLVLISLNKVNVTTDIDDMISNGYKFLRKSQNRDNGWGARQAINNDLEKESSIEESSLAIKALSFSNDKEDIIAFKRGIIFLKQIKKEGNITPTPIGLYFASLWYYEKLYPIIFMTDALNPLVGIKTTKWTN